MQYNPVHIIGTTLQDTWFQLLSALDQYGRKGIEITTGSHAGEHRVEFDSASGFIKYPHESPLAPIISDPEIPVPTTNDKIDEYFKEYLMNPNCLPNEEYRYAVWINGRIQNHFTGTLESQLEWIIRHFKEKGYGNNHCYISVGDKDSNFRYDKPYENETERGTSPCLKGIDFKIKENTLLMGIIYRSWDLFSGWPENMGGFTLLNEYVCDMLGDVDYGPLAFFSMGLHYYDHHLKAVMKVLNK